MSVNEIRDFIFSKIIIHQPKTFENSNIIDIRSVITEHPKTSHKLSKTIRQAEKEGLNTSLYSNTKKVNIQTKNCKCSKMRTCF